MILELNLKFILTHDSIARVLCDSLSGDSPQTFQQQFDELMHQDQSELEELVRVHMSRYGKLGIPTDKQIADRFSITEREASALVKTFVIKLESL